MCCGSGLQHCMCCDNLWYACRACLCWVWLFCSSGSCVIHILSHPLLRSNVQWTFRSFCAWILLSWINISLTHLSCCRLVVAYFHRLRPFVATAVDLLRACGEFRSGIPVPASFHLGLVAKFIRVVTHVILFFHHGHRVLSIGHQLGAILLIGTVTLPA